MSDLSLSEPVEPVGEPAADATADADKTGHGLSTSGRFWARFRRNKLALAAGGFLILELVLLLLAP